MTKTPTNLREQLEIDEGNDLVAYPDPLTKGAPYTIGRGHTGPEVHKGLVWTQAQSDAAFSQDMLTAIHTCEKAFPWMSQLNEARRAVIEGICYQMGLRRLSGFKKALVAIGTNNWEVAEKELLDSDWAKQTPSRAKRRAKQMKTGEWQ